MKRYANIRLLAAVALLVATAGCKDDEGPALKQPALLSIQDAAADAEVITVESPKKQTLSIRAEAEQISGNYITVVFKIDPELVETYNAAHGTSYKLCPSEAYAFSTTEVMLPRYNTVSSTMKVELFSERMPDEEPYLLPIAIDSIKGDPRATVSPTGNVSSTSSSSRDRPHPCCSNAAAGRCSPLPRPSPTTKWRRCSTKTSTPSATATPTRRRPIRLTTSSSIWAKR